MLPVWRTSIEWLTCAVLVFPVLGNSSSLFFVSVSSLRRIMAWSLGVSLVSAAI